MWRDEAVDDESFDAFATPFEAENDEYFEPADETETDEGSWSEESGVVDRDSYADDDDDDDDESESENEDDYEDDSGDDDDDELGAK